MIVRGCMRRDRFIERVICLFVFFFVVWRVMFKSGSFGL